MHNSDKNSGEDPKAIMKEVSEDWKNTRNSVAELIKYRLALMNSKDKKADEKINEYRHKAIDAINHLFDEDLNA